MIHDGVNGSCRRQLRPVSRRWRCARQRPRAAVGSRAGAPVAATPAHPGHGEWLAAVRADATAAGRSLGGGVVSAAAVAAPPRSDAGAAPPRQRVRAQRRHAVRRGSAGQRRHPRRHRSPAAAASLALAADHHAPGPWRPSPCGGGRSRHQQPGGEYGSADGTTDLYLMMIRSRGSSGAAAATRLASSLDDSVGNDIWSTRPRHLGPSASR